MSRTELLSRADTLRAERTPFVLATVVRAERPTSAKAGDAALVLPDGTLEGFVGGTCAESTVRLQGLRLLRSGESTLLRITPDAASSVDTEGMITVGNPCLSGGTLDIFLEANIPPPLVQVFGDAPVARALLRVGAALGYDMRPLTSSIRADAVAVVVASHGRDEEQPLVEALRAGVPYVALVASRRRGSAVLSSIMDGDRVHSPAGLDIGARTAPEIAVSILAEVIAARPRPVEAPAGSDAPMAELTVAVDPVCGMSVAVTETALTLEHAGRMWYFCGSGCRTAFADAPDRYLK
jgi:xanthine dehydrogenase accessory factor